MAPLEIILATHNGARYLSEQLDSLFRQTETDFTVLAADDASTDETLQILEAYRRRYVGRIEIVAFAAEAVGACGNFTRLAERLTADYAMFCDQDDVWLPHKIAVSLNRIRAAEIRFGSWTPLFIHTDLVVAGHDLAHWQESHWRSAKLDPSANSFNQLLLHNTVAGCTAIVNKALYTKAIPVPSCAIMHDYWFALVAAAFGRIEFIFESTILYRQHDRNVFGVEARTPSRFFRRAVETLRGRGSAENLDGYMRQARAFLSQFGADLTPRQRETLRVVADLSLTHPSLRFLKLLRLGVLRQGIVRNAALFIAVTLHRSRAPR